VFFLLIFNEDRKHGVGDGDSALLARGVSEDCCDPTFSSSFLTVSQCTVQLPYTVKSRVHSHHSLTHYDVDSLNHFIPRDRITKLASDGVLWTNYPRSSRYTCNSM
jgi:hypothetical protein